MTAQTREPPVTVLVATRDRVPLLRRALSSIDAQDYRGHLHTVVVFDGEVPEDLTLPELNPGRSREVIRNTATPGIAGARNQAIRRAETDLVALVDDDDVLLPGRLTAQVAIAQAHPEMPVVGGGITVLTERGRIERRPRTLVVHFADLLDDRIMELHTSTLLLRREPVVAIGGWDEELPGGSGEDYDLLLRLTREYGPIRLVDDLVAEVHWDVTSFYRNRWEVSAAALERLLVKFPEFASSPRGRARIYGQLAFANAALGRGSEARRWARLAWRDNRRERRTPLALLVSCGLLRPRWVQDVLNVRGRGI